MASRKRMLMEFLSMVSECPEECLSTLPSIARIVKASLEKAYNVEQRAIVKKADDNEE